MELPTETGVYLLTRGGEKEQLLSYSTVFLGVRPDYVYLFVPNKGKSRDGNMYLLENEIFLRFCKEQNIIEIQGPLQDDKKEETNGL
jgi:hypothetical protein